MELAGEVILEIGLAAEYISTKSQWYYARRSSCPPLMNGRSYMSNANRSQRHHYIPRMLLKHFCDADGMLWYGIRRDRRVIRISSRDAFVQTNLYTSYEDVQELSEGLQYLPDDRYEQEFSRLEGRAARALKKIIEGASHILDGGDVADFPVMSPIEMTAWKEFYVSMLNRTPDAIARVVARSGNQHPAEEALDDVLSKADPSDVLRFTKPEWDQLKDRIAHSVSAAFASSIHEHLPNGFELGDVGLMIAAYRNPKNSFIVGSNGVADVSRADAGSMGVQWLPIAPSVAIAMSDDPTMVTLRIDDDSLRRQINRSLAGSQFIAGHSRRLVMRHTRS